MIGFIVLTAGTLLLIIWCHELLDGATGRQNLKIQKLLHDILEYPSLASKCLLQRRYKSKWCPLP
jgi:hypothetical protein